MHVCKTYGMVKITYLQNLNPSKKFLAMMIVVKLMSKINALLGILFRLSLPSPQ